MKDGEDLVELGSGGINRCPPSFASLKDPCMDYFPVVDESDGRGNRQVSVISHKRCSPLGPRGCCIVLP